MKKISSIVLFTSILMSQVIMAQRVYPNKEKIKSDRIEIGLSPSLDGKVNLFTGDDQEGFIAAAAILPIVLSEGRKVLQYALKKREEKFLASYKDSQTEDNLFKSGETNLPIIDFERWVTLKGEDTEEEALNARFIPQLSTDKKAFLYKLESYRLTYSSAKAKSGDYLNVSVKIGIKYIGVDKDGKAQEISLGEKAIELKSVWSGVKLSGETGWFVTPAANDSLTGGAYEVTVTINEANPRVLRTKKIREFFESNGESIDKVVNVIVGS